MKKKLPHNQMFKETAKKNPKKISDFILKSFLEAEKGSQLKHGGPFGALIVLNNKIISSAHNTVLKDNDPTCHAEVNAIRKACKKLKKPHLEGAILIASSEPCPMCLTTAYWAHINVIYYGLSKTVAAQFGFIDDFIYKDLEKVPAKRKLHVIQDKTHTQKGKEIFTRWKKSGKLY